MNNSKTAIDSMFLETPLEVDVTPELREREQHTIKVLESLREVAKSTAWSTLKSLVFDEVVSNIQRRIEQEANKKKIDDAELYRLQGQLAWAKKYATLETLEQSYRIELQNIRQQLHGKREELH